MSKTPLYPKVKHLVCFAGPPCAGKTFAMQKLQKGDNPELAAILGIDDPTDWLAFSPGWMPPNCPAELDRAFFHYDFLRMWKFGGAHGQFESDDVLRILGECETIDIVTMLARSDVLRNRFTARPMLKTVGENLTNPKAMVNMMFCYFRLRKLYRDPQALKDLYAEWFDFTNQFDPKTHFAIDTSGLYTVVDIENIPARLMSSEEVS